MAKLYVLDLRPWLDGKWRELLPLLPEARQKKALACRRDADGARTACAGWLLQYALIQAGVPQEAQIFTENPWGKPLLRDRADLHFSLSHSGTWAVCAVGASPLGVDVEPPRCTIAMARRFFHPLEIEALERLKPEAQPDALGRLWTAKEAYLKALGRGLTQPLNSFAVTLTPEATLLDRSPYRLHEYRLGDYFLCLCTPEARPEMALLSK